jgi:hypothetical protein
MISTTTFDNDMSFDPKGQFFWLNNELFKLHASLFADYSLENNFS